MYRVIVASNFTDAEEAAFRYWKQGNDGWGFSDIRAIVNGRVPPHIQQLRNKDLGMKANDMQSSLEEIARDMVSAIQKCPSVRGQEIYRVEGHYRVPRVGSEIELEMFTSFSKTLSESLLNNFGVPDGGVVYRLIANDSFRDISRIGKSSQDAEAEVLSIKTMKYKVLDAKEERIGGEETWLGVVGGETYTIVDLKPLG